jgi:hypothetical protein
LSYPFKIGDVNVHPAPKKRFVDPIWIITLAVVLVGTIHVIYTVRTFDLVQEQHGKSKFVHFWPIFSISRRQKSSENLHRVRTIDGVMSRKFVPLHEPLVKQFEYLKDNDKKTLFIAYKGVIVSDPWTPAQMEMVAGDLIKIYMY